MTRIVLRVYPIDVISDIYTEDEAYRTWADRPNTRFFPGDTTYDALKALYDSGTPLVYDYDSYFYAETPQLANPVHATQPTHEPHPWMMALNPFNPRPSVWETTDVNGWINLPATGQAYTRYLVREGNELFNLVWNTSTQKYESATAAQPDHQDAVFNPVVQNYTVYNSDGTPAASQRIDFSAGETEIPTTALALNSDNDKIVAAEHINATVSLELTGSAANGANAANYNDGTDDQTTAPTSFAGRVRLILKTTVPTGTIETTIHSQTFTGSVVAGESTEWNVRRLKQKAIMPANAELYAVIDTLSDSTETDPRSSVLAVVSGHLTVERYQAEAAIDYAEEIPWEHRPLENQELQHAYVSFPLDTPIPLEDFPKMTAKMRFQRSGGDFNLSDDFDMKDFYLFPDQNAAEAGTALLDPNRWVTGVFFSDRRGDFELYSGTPWPGWDEDSNFYTRIRLWFWGSNGKIEGVRAYCYQTQISQTRVWLSLRFGR